MKMITYAVPLQPYGVYPYITIAQSYGATKTTSTIDYIEGCFNQPLQNRNNTLQKQLISINQPKTTNMLVVNIN